MEGKICTCKSKCYWKAYHFWGLTSLFYHSMNFKGFSHPSFKRRVSDSMWNYLWCEREVFLKSTLLALQERLFCHSNIIATFKNSLYSRVYSVFHLKKKPAWNGFQALSALPVLNFSLVCNFLPVGPTQRRLFFNSWILIIPLEFIETHWDSLRLIETHWDSLRLIETHWDSLRLIETHEDLLEEYWG